MTVITKMMIEVLRGVEIPNIPVKEGIWEGLSTGLMAREHQVLIEKATGKVVECGCLLWASAQARILLACARDESKSAQEDLAAILGGQFHWVEDWPEEWQVAYTQATNHSEQRDVMVRFLESLA